MSLTDRIGHARLFLSDISGGHRMFDHNIRGELKNSVEVPTTTLQQFMDEQQISRIDFLKLDCEGFEGRVLASTPGGYLEKIRKIAMEFHDDVSQPTHEGIVSLLAKAGFKTKTVWDERSPYGYIYARKA
jgi:hypothetical protein